MVIFGLFAYKVTITVVSFSSTLQQVKLTKHESGVNKNNTDINYLQYKGHSDGLDRHKDVVLLKRPIYVWSSTAWCFNILKFNFKFLNEFKIRNRSKENPPLTS